MRNAPKKLPMANEYGSFNKKKKKKLRGHPQTNNLPRLYNQQFSKQVFENGHLCITNEYYPIKSPSKWTNSRGITWTMKLIIDWSKFPKNFDIIPCVVQKHLNKK